MGEVTSQHWEPVGSFSAPAPAADPIALVEAVAQDSAQRFSADDGARAVVVPLEAVAPALLSIPEVPAQAQVVFVDPPDAATVQSLGAAEVLPASVWIALPEGAVVPGLVAVPGRLVLGTASGTVPHVLFRSAAPAQEHHDMRAGAPRVGESADVADQRAKWFGSREGGQG